MADIKAPCGKRPAIMRVWMGRSKSKRVSLKKAFFEDGGQIMRFRLRRTKRWERAGKALWGTSIQ